MQISNRFLKIWAAVLFLWSRCVCGKWNRAEHIIFKMRFYTVNIFTSKIKKINESTRYSARCDDCFQNKLIKRIFLFFNFSSSKITL
jgi:hypothetical protein